MEDHLSNGQEGVSHEVEEDAVDENVNMEGYEEMEYIDLDHKDGGKRSKNEKKRPKGIGKTTISNKHSLTSEMKSTRAATRVIQRLGVDRVQEIQAEYASLKSKFGEVDYEKANAIIRNLMTMGLSQIEIRGMIIPVCYLINWCSTQIVKPTEPVSLDTLIHIPVLTYMPNLIETISKKLSMFPLLAGRLSFIPLDMNIFTSPSMEPSTQQFLNHAQILVSDSALCASALLHMPHLKWVQLTSPALQNTIFIQQRRDFKLTRAGGILGIHFAQYVLGWIINKERSFDKAKQLQAKREFSPDSLKYRLSKDVTIGILGCGDIGMDIAKLLFSAGFRVLGLKRHQSAGNLLDGFDMTANLSEVLSRADYIVNLLPHTQDTLGMLDGDILRLCMKKRPWFIHFGSLHTMSEDTVLLSLQQKWLNGIILNLHDALDTNSDLWTHPDVDITPYVQPSTMTEEVADLMLKNLWLYMGNAPLHYQVDWPKEY